MLANGVPQFVSCRIEELAPHLISELLLRDISYRPDVSGFGGPIGRANGAAGHS